MPHFIPIPVPHTVATYAKEIQDAALATFQADPSLKVDGSLGVKTVEIRYPQPDGMPRFYSKDKLPAIHVFGRNENADPGATKELDLAFELVAGVVAQKAGTRDGYEQIIDIQGVLALSIYKNVLDNQTTWLASGNEIRSGSPLWSSEEPEQDEEISTVFYAKTVFPFFVQYDL